MKKIFIFLTLFIALTATGLFAARGGGTFARAQVPEVAYMEPDNDSVVDLSGKSILTFTWKSVPIPSGGRAAYKINIYNGFGYDVAFSETLDPKVFSTEVPADKFEDGKIYSWHVKQRDDRSMSWSRYDTWSFKVIKKE